MQNSVRVLPLSVMLLIMSKSNFKDHFSSGSAGYANYRPTYPIQLVEELAQISPALDVALDCGCGSGQLSILLAEKFKTVVATDASAAQIENAQPKAGVKYKVALAENSGLPDHSVDLITVAQAAHWLDLEKFYAEVRRVARPQAAIALITYGIMHIEGTKIDEIALRFYNDVVGPYWPPERALVEEGYRSLAFPFHERKLPHMNIEVMWNLSELVGYFGTWSATRAAEKALGHNPVIEVEKELLSVWGAPETRRKIVWPLAMRVGNL